MLKSHIETDRLILRELQESDADAMYELDSNPLVHKYLGNKPITTKQQAIDGIRFVRQQYQDRGIGRFAAIEKTSGDFIGWSGLKLNSGPKEQLNNMDHFIDIGYRLIPRFWGKGYATESAIASLNYGFHEKSYDTIYGAAEIGNVASNTVLKKIGLGFVNQFLYDGELINWYELKREDYEKVMS